MHTGCKAAFYIEMLLTLSSSHVSYGSFNSVKFNRTSGQGALIWIKNNFYWKEEEEILATEKILVGGNNSGGGKNNSGGCVRILDTTKETSGF